MTVRQYDKVRLKDGRSATIVDILEEGVAYIADIDLPNSDWETVEIRHSDILNGEDYLYPPDNFEIVGD